MGKIITSVSVDGSGTVVFIFSVMVGSFKPSRVTVVPIRDVSVSTSYTIVEGSILVAVNGGGVKGLNVVVDGYLRNLVVFIFTVVHEIRNLDMVFMVYAKLGNVVD